MTRAAGVPEPVAFGHPGMSSGWAGRYTRSPYIWALAVFALSVTANLAFGIASGFRSSVAMLDQDELEYWRIARAMLAGEAFPAGRRTPGFPATIAVLQMIDPSIRFVSVVLSVLSATAAPLLLANVYRLSRSLPAGILAGLLMALWPSAIFFGASLYSETLALPIFLLFLLLLPRPSAYAQARARRYLAIGAVLGICALVRPMYQLFLPILPLLFLLDSRSIAATVRAFLITLAGFALTVLPWSAYVTAQTGHFVLLSSNGGETLSGGFNANILKMENATIDLEKRSAWVGPGKWISVGENGYLDARESALSYEEQDRLLRTRTLAWMTGNPDLTVYLAVRKIAYLWGYYPWERNGVAQVLFGNIPIIALQLLCLAALLRSPRIRRECARFYLLALFVTGVALISWGSWRFRQPADAGLIAIAAIALSDRFVRKSRRGAAS